MTLSRFVIMRKTKTNFIKFFGILSLMLTVQLTTETEIFGQRTDLPSLGAQVFIEPGQSPEMIDSWFECLEKNHMDYARIRMFGTHVQDAAGNWDFSLYDQAFESAAKHGIKLFVTLFPKTDELTDVGGFKFPRSEKHLEEVGEYIDAVVEHFKDKEAMFAWVLQNEPGTGSMNAPKTELSTKLKEEWMAEHQPAHRDGYLKADFSEQDFLVWYNVWYLKWISERVQQKDSRHYRHINPHQIMELLPEYDFAALEKILTSLGASMHLSWHFSYFEQQEFPMAISLMADIIRGNALGNPFWITELQGGNVTASGYRVLCPTGNEVAQWLWSGIGSGAEGIVFWTLNQRAAVSEAGEWGLLNFQNGQSDRLQAASDVAKAVKDNESVMKEAKPYLSDISILYNTQSLWIQKWNHNTVKDTENDGRSKGAVMKSVAAAYDAISAWGVNPQVADMKFYDWSKAEGRAIVLPNIISIPSEYYDKIRSFVKNGGRIVVTGLTGYYDENMKCSFMGHFPLADVFGAECSEIKAGDKYFALPKFRGATLDAHLWRGVLAPAGGKAELESNNEVYAVRNRYGKGEVLWFPSMIDLGNWHRNEKALSEFYGKELMDQIACAPVYLEKPVSGLTLRTMTSGDNMVVIAINKNTKPVHYKIKGGFHPAGVIFDNMTGQGMKGKMKLLPEECTVSVWTK